MAYRILVIDDDPEILTLLSEFLTAQGMSVMARPSVEAAVDLLPPAAQACDLLVLDVNLPGESGLDLCRRLRALHALPVVLLTARGDPVDRIVGIELGADDYVVKPFDPRELVARIRAVLRRVRAPAGPADPGEPEAPAPAGTATLRRLSFSGWVLDLARRELRTGDGTLVMLSTSEFDLLAVLLERPLTVVSRNELMTLTRGREADPLDRTIDIDISRLRRKLRDDPANPRFIKTVRNAGYLFLEPVEAVR